MLPLLHGVDTFGGVPTQNFTVKIDTCKIQKYKIKRHIFVKKNNNKQNFSWKFVMKNHIHVPVGGENEPISGAENLLSGWGDILMFWLDSYKNKQ